MAELHVESGWVPPDTRVDALEGAIRAVCEPHFDRPLKDISLGQVLMRLFQTSRRFNVEIQPQLVLLQKTLLNIEGLGRQLDPELDLWTTAKPFLERWMNEQIGWRGLVERLKNEAPRYAQLLPELPRLLHQRAAAAAPRRASRAALLALLAEQRRTNRLLQGLLWASAGLRARAGAGARRWCTGLGLSRGNARAAYNFAFLINGLAPARGAGRAGLPTPLSHAMPIYAYRCAVLRPRRRTCCRRSRTRC